MMGHLAAMERTEKQWRALLESAGLRYVQFTIAEGSLSGILEVEAS